MNLPLKHPVNLAYEAATVDLDDVNMIDPFHLEAYGETTVNYNRDIEIFPVLEAMFRKIYGSCPYKSPTDMGVNMAGFAIVDDEACREASKQEIIRRYFSTACAVKKGLAAPAQLHKMEVLMQSLDLTPELRRTVPAARAVAERTGEPAMAIELADGKVITGKTSALMGASCAAMLNALKHSGGHRRPGGSHLPPRCLPPSSTSKGGAPGKPQSPPAHRRDAHRPVHLRRHQSHRGACHGSPQQPPGRRGALHGDSLFGG